MTGNGSNHDNVDVDHNDDNDDNDDLPALRAPHGPRQSGRRSDAAFARAVAADVEARVEARRGPGRRFFSLPAVLATSLAAAAAIVVVVRAPERGAERGAGHDAGSAIAWATLEAVAADDDASLAAVDVDDADEFDDATLLALAGPVRADGGSDGSDDGVDDVFAIPALDGSTPGELAAIEAALDRALKL